MEYFHSNNCSIVLDFPNMLFPVFFLTESGPYSMYDGKYLWLITSVFLRLLGVFFFTFF